MSARCANHEGQSAIEELTWSGPGTPPAWTTFLSMTTPAVDMTP